MMIKSEEGPSETFQYGFVNDFMRHLTDSEQEFMSGKTIQFLEAVHGAARPEQSDSILYVSRHRARESASGQKATEDDIFLTYCGRKV